VEQILLFLLGNLLFYGDVAGDPIHAAWGGRSALRDFECERLPQAEAHDRFPASVPAPNARTTVLVEIDALVCGHRIVERDARSPRDEAILSRLGVEVDELSALASQRGSSTTHWVVDAHYPNPVLVRKIATASRVALAERGLAVSDTTPLLSAGDVEILRTLPMRDALPHACRRLYETNVLESQSFGDDVAFLSIALLDANETQLHAGTCQKGTFTWLR
jgi:hypothetical protein